MRWLNTILYTNFASLKAPHQKLRSMNLHIRVFLELFRLYAPHQVVFRSRDSTTYAMFDQLQCLHIRRSHVCDRYDPSQELLIHLSSVGSRKVFSTNHHGRFQF
jgi:hypothetical protein